MTDTTPARDIHWSELERFWAQRNAVGRWSRGRGGLEAVRAMECYVGAMLREQHIAESTRRAGSARVADTERTSR